MKANWLWLALAGGLIGTVQAQDNGPVTIGGVTYDAVDPGEPFTEAPRPEQDWAPPEPTPAETAAGMTAYVTSDAGDYRPYRIPKLEERVTQLAAFMTPGETEPVWVGVYGLADLAGLTLDFDVGGAPVTAEVRHLHFWPQRTGWTSRQWYMTPELILPCRDGKRMVPAKRGVLEEKPFTLAQGETAAFWLTLKAPRGAAAGLYGASVSIRGKGRPALKLPLRIEILPFELRRPQDRYWVMYADVGRWSHMSEGQILAEMRDFADHGMTGLVEMPLGSYDLSGLSAGKVAFDAGAYLKLAALGREAGLPGPHVCLATGAAGKVREALGWKGDLKQGEWPAEIKASVVAIARAAIEATADESAKWLFYGVDEMGPGNTYAVQEYEAWRQGGARAYSTANIKLLEQGAKFFTAPCYQIGLVNSDELARAARERCARNGTELWVLGTGSYVNHFPQESCLANNRYGAGYSFWKTGGKAQVSWTFCRVHGDVFNDFDGGDANPIEPKDQVTAYPHLLRPDDWSTYQGAIPTLAWEGLREGVEDYRYLYTLTRIAAEARKSPRKEARDAAGEAEEALRTLVQSIPWIHPFGPVAFDTGRMQQVRRTVADRIVELQAVLKGQTRP